MEHILERSTNNVDSKNNVTSQKGSTVIEALAAIAILSIMLSSIVNVVQNSSYMSLKTAHLAEQTANVHLGLHTMKAELNMASTVSPYYPGWDASLNDCSQLMCVEDDVIQFVMSRDSKEDKAGYQPVIVRYQYNAADNTIYRKEDLLDPLITCDAIDDAEISNIALTEMQPFVTDVFRQANQPVFDVKDNNRIFISLLASAQVKQGVVKQALSTSVRVRTPVSKDLSAGGC